MSKDFNLNINSANQAEAAASMPLDGASDNFQAKKAIDLEGLDNLKQLQERYPEKFASSVYNEQGEPVSREELEKLNEQAGKIGVDKVGASDIADDKEENEAISNLYNLKSLKKLSPEQFEKLTHTKDGELKSKEDLQKIDQNINEGVLENYKEEQTNSLAENIKAASEKYQEKMDELVQKRKELAEKTGAEFDEEKEREKIRQGLKPEDKLATVTDRSNVEAEFDITKSITTEEAKNIAQNIDNYNNFAEDDKDMIGPDASAEDIYKGKLLGFCGEKIDAELEEIEDSLQSLEQDKQKQNEQTKGANSGEKDSKKPAAVNTQGQDSPAVSEDSEEKKYIKSEMKGKEGSHSNNLPASQQNRKALENNLNNINIHNRAIFQAKFAKTAEKIGEEGGKLNFANENDAFNSLYAADFSKEKGGSTIEEMKEKIAELQQKGIGAADFDPAGGASGAEKKFNPYKDMSAGASADNILNGGDKDGASSILEFKLGNNGSLDELKTTKEEIKAQADGGSVATNLDKELETETDRKDNLASDIQTAEQRYDIFETGISGNENSAMGKIEADNKKMAEAMNTGLAAQAELAKMQKGTVIPAAQQHNDDKTNQLEKIAKPAVIAATAHLGFAEAQLATAESLPSVTAADKATKELAVQAAKKQVAMATKELTAATAFQQFAQLEKNDSDKNLAGQVQSGEKIQYDYDAMAKQNEIIAKAQAEQDKITAEYLDAMAKGAREQVAQLAGAKESQTKRVEDVKAEKEQYLSYLEQDEQSVDNSIAQAEKQQAGKTDESQAAGNNADEDSKNDFKITDNEELNLTQKMIGQNELMDDGRNANKDKSGENSMTASTGSTAAETTASTAPVADNKSAGAENKTAGNGSTVQGTGEAKSLTVDKNEALSLNKDKSEVADKTETENSAQKIEFKAFKKEKEDDTNTLERGAELLQAAGIQAKQKSIDMFSRRVANINNADSGLGKTLTA